MTSRTFNNLKELIAKISKPFDVIKLLSLFIFSRLLPGTNRDYLRLEPQISCTDFGWFSALQLVSLATEVFVDIKTTIFYNAFCPLILRLELSHNAS